MEIIRQAQAQMRAAGSTQWQDGYPARCDIEADILHGRGWVACIDTATAAHAVVGYAAIVFDGEPAYDALEGSWHTPVPYVVIHRLAVADEAKRHGVATAMMRHAETLAAARGIDSFRIDTAHKNLPMQSLLQQLGFSPCGTVRYRSGERIAYDKPIGRHH